MKNLSFQISLFIICILFFLVYRSTFGWLIERYLEPDSYYSHGFLVPFISAFLIFLKRKRINFEKKDQNFIGMGLIIFSMGLHFFSLLSEFFFMDGISLVILVLGISIFLFGKSNTREMLFPIFFLLFMIPLPLVAVNAISFPMKMLVTKSAVFILDNLFRIPVRNEGFQIFFPQASLIVENPCSGLRSLISFLALGSLFANFLKSSLSKKYLLFVLSILISFISNLFRVILLSLGVFIYGNGAAHGFFHDLTGLLVFILGFVFLLIAARTLHENA